MLKRLFGLLAKKEDDGKKLVDNLYIQLYRDEGEVLHAYQDSLGYWTIGVGRLIDKRKGGGISAEESKFLFDNDIRKVQEQVYTALPWARQLDEARQGVLLNMCFQMGIGSKERGTGLLGFKNTLTMVERGDYESAAQGMMNSLWARQTPNRAKRLAEQMRSGEWQ